MAGPVASAGNFGVQLDTGIVEQYVPPTVVVVGTVELPAPDPNAEEEDD